MKNSRWLPWDRLMRASHLYTGMFLFPWMVVYAVSAFLINHNTWFLEKNQPAQKWETVREADFATDADFPSDTDEQAVAILEALDLDGAYRIMGVPDANQLTLLRLCAAGHYKITLQRPRNHVVVERLRPVSAYSLINNLHFVTGYGVSSSVYLIWAVIVDAVTISTIIWIISGVYLWARRPKRRLLGGVCMTAGIALFAVLVVLLCR
jgi:hypothetical protein